MKLSIQHLNTYFKATYSTAELTAAIEKSGIELEGVYSPIPLNTKIIVGLTKKVIQHPNADKLRLVLVDVGAEANLHIVCGAPNVEEDIKVAVATVGSVLPDGLQIKEAKLRGELSQGMLCSEAELGWSDNHDGIVVLPADYQVGASLCDIAPGDDIVDIKSAANRSDLQSYDGVAREIAAQLGIKLILPSIGKVDVPASTRLVKKLPKSVLAYGATLVEFSNNGIHKDIAFYREMVLVLAASGVRSINPIVDVTNYILLTTGQPLHAFDADKVSLPLEVRYAIKGETLETLDGKNRKLTTEDLVIADAKGPIALAGVMGGSGSEVSSTTSSIILESATFASGDVRKMAQRHGIRTDASARYERGLPVELSDRGRALAIGMFAKLGAKPLSGARLGMIESEKTIVEVKPQNVDALLGITITPKDMIKHLTVLGFEVGGLAKLKVRVPWWRPDVSNGSDIAEEIIKMVGLDALPATIPAWSPEAITFDTTRALTDRVRELLRAAGLFELTTYSFISEDDISRFGLKPAQHLKLKNPMSIEQAYMRSTLLPSLVKVMEANQRYAKQFGVSELSRVFIPSGKKGQLPYEPYRIGVSVMGDYFAAKAPLDLIARELRLDFAYVPSKHPQYYPGRQANILLSDVVIGSVGELHPRLTNAIKGKRSVSFAEVDLLAIINTADSQTYAPISKFPSISRDIAVIVNKSVLWADVVAEINAALPEVKLSFLSRYEGDGIAAGKISLALHATMSDMKRTLTDAEADEMVEQIMSILAKKFAATPRS